MENTTIITYQGTQVEAEIISEINIERDYAPGRELYDSILRDEAGRYYLHRDIAPGERVHQISLPAAIIWATRNRCNGESRPLYIDASNLLTDGRGVDDPPPFPYMSREEWQASDEYKALPPRQTPPVVDAKPHAEVFALLDDYARALLRQDLDEHPDTDPRDVLNGAVDFLLSEDDPNGWA